MKRLITITLAIAALAATFAVGWAIRPSDATTAQLTAATSQPTPQQRYEGFVGAVAAKAGVNRSTLDNAIRSVAEEKVAQAADDGRLSQKTAATIETAIKNGTVADLIHRRLETDRRPLLRLLHRLDAGK